MRKVFLLVLIQFLVFSLTAQNDVLWKKIDNSKDKYDFQYFIKIGKDGYKAVFTIPQNKPFQQTKHSVFIRNYNKDLSDFTETGIPAESPLTLSIEGYQNYNVITGSMDDNSNPMSQFGKDNRIVVTDDNMNPLITRNFPLHGKRHKFTGSPAILLSSDSAFMIVANSEIQNPDKPSLKEAPIMRYIDIYDKDLSLVWSDSVNFDQIFGEKTNAGSFELDYINGKLVLMASCVADGIKKIKATLFVAVFDRPQSYKLIMNKVFPYDDFSYRTLITKEGKIYISGVNMMNSNAPFSQPKKQLFYLCKDIYSPSQEPVFRTYEIDKTFEAKYPEYKQWLTESLRGPFAMFLINGKIYYFSEYRYYSTSSSSSGSSSSTTYYFKHITMMCFDNDGNIEWLEMINKFAASKLAYNDFFCQAFQSGNNICLFYYDYADNIAASKYVEKPRFVGDDKLWLAMAVVSPDGDVQKSMVTNIGDHKVRAVLNRTEKITDKKFMFIGRSTKPFNYDEVSYGFYELN